MPTLKTAPKIKPQTSSPKGAAVHAHVPHAKQHGRHVSKGNAAHVNREGVIDNVMGGVGRAYGALGNLQYKLFYFSLLGGALSMVGNFLGEKGGHNRWYSKMFAKPGSWLLKPQEIEVSNVLGKLEKIPGVSGGMEHAEKLSVKAHSAAAEALDKVKLPGFAGDTLKNKVEELRNHQPGAYRTGAVSDKLNRAVNIGYAVSQVYGVGSALNQLRHSMRLLYADANGMDVRKVSIFKALISKSSNAVVKEARAHFWKVGIVKALFGGIAIVVQSLALRLAPGGSGMKTFLGPLAGGLAVEGLGNLMQSQRDVLHQYHVVATKQSAGQALSQQEYAGLIDAAIPKGQKRPENSIDWAAALYARNGTDVAQVLSDVNSGKVELVAEQAYQMARAAQAEAATPAAAVETNAAQSIQGKHTEKVLSEQSRNTASLESALNKTSGAYASV